MSNNLFIFTNFTTIIQIITKEEGRVCHLGAELPS
jgi:hypothetical protein